MGVTVESRAHRTLKSAAHYRKVDWTELLEIYGSNLFELVDEESPIGFYYNYVDSVEMSIVVTNLGLHIFSNHNWRLISFDDLVDVNSQLSYKDVPKDSVNELFLSLVDGSTFVLNVLGKDGRYKDVFDFHRFLLRVIGDRAEQ
ncbi:MAG: hypothetical protein ABW170_23445 [Candidatus Thiodiazotropha sp. L084R]